MACVGGTKSPKRRIGTTYGEEILAWVVQKSPKRRVGTTYGEEKLAWVVWISLSGELNLQTGVARRKAT